MFVCGVEEVVVRNKSEVYDVLEKGAKRRKTAATNLNARSRLTHLRCKRTFLHLSGLKNDDN